MTLKRLLEKQYFAWLILVLLCIMVMLPRLVSPDFGLLDDGISLVTAEQIEAGGNSLSSEDITGRYRPGYWFFNFVLFKLFHYNPLGYFLANLVLLAGTAICLEWLIRRNSHNPLLSFLSSFFFITSGPVMEAYFTNSKPEPFQLFILLLLLVCIDAFCRASNMRSKVLLAMALLPLAWVAFSIKETSVILLPILAAWRVLAWWNTRKKHAREALSSVIPLLVSGLAFGVYFCLRGRALDASIVEGAYTGRYSFALDNLFASSVRWAGWFLRDFPFLFPLALGAILAWMRARNVSYGYLLLQGIVWVGGWVGIYLPWSFTAEYYLLPMAAGMGLLCAILTLAAMDSVSSFPRAVGRSSQLLLILVAGVLWGTVQLRNVAIGRVQIAVDRANAAMLDYLAEETPEGVAIAINLPYQSEYRYEIELHLAQLMGRPDLAFDDGLFSIDDGTVVEETLFGVTAIVDNVVRQGPRIGALTSEAEFDSWLQNFRTQGGRAALLFSTQEHVRLFNLDLFQLGCFLFPDKAFCATETPLLDRRVFHYGWDVYRLTP